MSYLTAMRRRLAFIAVPAVLVAGTVSTAGPAAASPAARPQSPDRLLASHRLASAGAHRASPARALAPLAVDSVVRIQGPTRVATALEASRSLFDAVATPGAANAVVLARSDQFPDALAGVPLAAAADGPLLITPPAGLDSQVATEIGRILPKDKFVYLLGGTGALSQGVEDAVRALGYANVLRLQGPTRFDTAVAIAKQVDSILAAPQPLVFIVTGRNFPDALSAGAAAGDAGGTLVLSSDGTLPQAVADYVAAQQSHQGFVVTVGGPAAASFPQADVSLVGANRYQTSAMVAQSFFVDPTTNTVPLVAGLATGTNFPDALSGGAFMALVGGPMLLTTPAALEANARTFLHANAVSINTAFIFGGSGAVALTVDGEVSTAIAG